MLLKRRVTDEFLSELKKVGEAIVAVKQTVFLDKVGKTAELLSKTAKLDDWIKKNIDETEQQAHFREMLASTVRDLGVFLYKDSADPETARIVFDGLLAEFDDLPDVAEQLNADKEDMERRLKKAQAAAELEKKATRANIKLHLLLALGFAFLLALGVISSGRTDGSTPSSATLTPAEITETVKEPQKLPKSGEVLEKEWNYYSRNTLTIINKSNYNYYIKFSWPKATYSSSFEKPHIAFFVRANSTAVIDMPTGDLEMRYAYGTTWYGTDDLFGEETRYAWDKALYDFTTESWEITIEPDGSDMASSDTVAIDANGF